jgi:hypothetical protein
VDEVLQAFLDAAPGDPVPAISLLLDSGAIVSGAVVAATRFSDDLRALVEEELAAAEARSGQAEALRALADRIGDAEHGAYLTIGEPEITMPDGTVLEPPFLRVRAQSVSAWWARALEDEDDAVDLSLFEVGE